MIDIISIIFLSSVPNKSYPTINIHPLLWNFNYQISFWMIRLDPTSKKTDSDPDEDPILSFDKNPDLSKTPVSKIEVEIPY